MERNLPLKPQIEKEKQPKIENELKYTVRIDLLHEGTLERSSSALITQGYLVINNDYEKRVRSKKDTQSEKIAFTMTEKWSGETAESRPEKEEPITEAAFNQLWPSTEGKRVEKTRYDIPYSYNDSRTGEPMNVVIELDIYSGSHEGLIVAEVEFTRPEDMPGFVAPEWFNKNVTKEKSFKNKNLALAKPEEVQKLIESTE